MSAFAWISWRARRGISRHHVARQRKLALIMIFSGLARVVVWQTLIVLYLVGVAFAVHLFRSVSFVALLSVLALELTDWGQVAASMAQLTAGDVHHEVQVASTLAVTQHTRLDEEIARLAELQPGAEAQALASSIRARIVPTA